MSLTFAPASRSGQVRSGLVWGFSCQAVVLGCADGIEFTIIRDMSTANLAFIAGKTDWIATTIPLMKDITSRAPAAICEVTPGGISRNLMINRDRPPFNDPEMRRAMALSIDRRAFINIISEGQGDIGGVMQPFTEGLWGIPEEVLKTLPGYDPDMQKNRAEARAIMRNLGYGPDRRVQLKVSTRNIPPYRDPAVLLTDQLEEVFVDGELEIVETASWFPKVARKDYTIGANLTGGGVDDPDQQLYENYGCGSPRNYTGYCNPELEQLFDRQSMEAYQGTRRKLVWETERKLAEDGARPIIFYNRFAYCWQRPVKGWTMMVNSIINNWRMEDVWLDR